MTNDAMPTADAFLALINFSRDYAHAIDAEDLANIFPMILDTAPDTADADMIYDALCSFYECD